MTQMYFKRASLIGTNTDLSSMCLAEFATTFVTNYQRSNDSECDALPPAESETTSKKMLIALEK